MKLPYENELYELRKWIDFTNANLQMQFLHTPQEIQRVYQWINAIMRGIQTDYPFYAATLPRIASVLFIDNGMGTFILNQAAFGELVIIIRHIEAEPVVVSFWSVIHPRIKHQHFVQRVDKLISHLFVIRPDSPHAALRNEMSDREVGVRLVGKKLAGGAENAFPTG